MSYSQLEDLRKSNRLTINARGLLEGFKLYLLMNNRQNEYMSRLVYVRKNIPETEYSLYGVKNMDELIVKLEKLYETDQVIRHAM